MTLITEQKAGIEARIRAAALAAGRDPAELRILGVSKRQPRDKVAAALAAGIRDLGENYLQDAIARITEFGNAARWHFIGRVQANKTRAIAEHFDWVQTVSNARIARRLSAQRPCHAGELNVCIQIAPWKRPERGGALPEELPALAAEIASLPRLKLRGLMCMPLPDQEPAALEAEFRAARALYDQLCAAGHELDTLSMGMSHDLEIAVAAGSTLLRIGTALFGERK